MVPQTCGKRQLCRGLGARTPAARERAATRYAPRRAAARRALLLALAGAGAAAQPAPPELVVSSTLERIAAADQAIAGADELVVSVKFTNTTEHVVDSIRITSRVPDGTAYVAESASGPGSEVLFSIDGGRTFGRPAELVLPGVDGAARAADPALYTHVRWILRAPLDAGASGLTRFRAVPR